ncbi:family 10 glycosylhydrolase [Candidatus Sumerlaeota bacterium]|nr:family 10 glycosylhydrolase [Candidatus Sumerlaeota bacterium]
MTLSARPLIALTLATVALLPPPACADEIRAVWVTRWDYTTPTEVETILDNIAAHGFNTVLFQVRGNGTTFYPSALEPWAWELTGSNPSTLGTDPGWDPLALAVSHGHSLGLEIHAYMNTYPGWRGTTPPPTGISPEQLWNAHPEWFCVDSDLNPMALRSDYVVLSPGIPDVQAYLADIYEEVVSNWDVDGVHFDYVRYYGSDYSWDPVSLARFAAEYPGATPETHPSEWEQWRRDQVTALVASVEAETHASEPACQVSAATWSSYSSGSTTYGQDSWGWLAAGQLDVSHPMIYTSTNSTHWTRTEQHVTNAADRFVSAGIGLHLFPSDAARLATQIQNTRDLGAHGCTVFAYSSLFPGHTPGATAAALAAGPFLYPDNPPPMLWLTMSGDDDNTGPRLFNVRTDPSPPGPGVPFDVLVEATDVSGIFDDATGPGGQGMFVRWALDADPAGGTAVQMSHQSGDTFVTDAPITLGGMGTIHLQITGFDNDIDTGTADRASRETAIFSFETGETPIYVFDAVIGPSMTLPQYAVMDPQGMIWVCDWSGGAVRVFDSDGTPAAFDPITQGLDGSGSPVNAVYASGVGCGPDGTVYVTIDNDYDAPLCAGILLFDSATGTPLTGIDLPYRPGDCDLDRDGNLCVVEKVNERWHHLSPPGVFSTDTAFGPGTAGHINRGIACSDGGAVVYIADQTNDAVHVWNRTSTSPPVYVQGSDLTSTSGDSGGVDVDAHGWVFAGNEGNNSVLLFSEAGALQQEIQGGSPVLASPRGVAHTPSSDFIFIAPLSAGQVQRWVRTSPFPVPAGLVFMGTD